MLISHEISFEIKENKDEIYFQMNNTWLNSTFYNLLIKAFYNSIRCSMNKNIYYLHFKVRIWPTVMNKEEIFSNKTHFDIKKK